MKLKEIIEIIRFFFLLSVLYTSPLLLFSEGSREIYGTNPYDTYLSFCNDFVGQCSGSGGVRSQFAVYGCAETDRLYFIMKNLSETIYMGFQGDANGNQDHIVFRIKDLSGNIVYPEANLPINTSPTGYIANIAAARVGPVQIFGATGYTAIDFHPNETGTFYIEFQRLSNSTNQPVNGQFYMNLFDITVYDTVTLSEKRGRLYSKAWQFEENNHCTMTTYTYSFDSITTSCAFNNMQGGIWIQFCNQWGCHNTGNFASDRKSLHNQQVLLPEYPVFINKPDSTLYPPATTLGQIVPPQPWGEGHCATGEIVFHVNVDKPGNVEIDLTFPVPYVTRILTATVVVGENLILWDGLDGTLPTGVPVPNGTTVTFTVKYINGLTNLPFYDVEGNPSGFNISIVRPWGAEPLVFWDDSNIPAGTTNFTGCLSPPGCHTWSGAGQGFGNLNTINTWWYNVSTSTSPIIVQEIRLPQTISFVQTLQNVCAGTNGVFISVNPEPNTVNYIFGYTGIGATIIQINPTDPFITINFANNATSGNITVYGTNTNCAGQGPTSFLPVTIKPVPIVNAPFAESICSGAYTNFFLTSTPASTDFSWTNPPPSCSGNILACPTGLNHQNLINDQLSLMDLNPGTVTYHVVSTLNGCTGQAQDIAVTVNPLPNVQATPLTTSICSGQTTNIQLSSSVPSTTFTWTASGSSGNVSGFSNGTGNLVSQTLTNSGNVIETVTYSIMPAANGCSPLTPSTYVVTVYPIPNVFVNSTTPTICSGQTTNINLFSFVSTASFSWTVTASSGNLSGFSNGTGNHIAQTITNNGFTTETVTYVFTVLANGCSPLSSTPYTVTVYPTPNLLVTSTTPTVCSGQTTNIQLSSSVTGTTFSWTCTASSPNLSGFSNSNGNLVSQTLTNTGYTTETVTYHLLPQANGCNGSNSDYVVTVYPTPDLTNNPASKQICNNTPTNITLTSHVAGTQFTWICTASSVNLSGYSDNPVPTTSLNQTLTNAGFTVETVTYHIAPVANGCSGTITDYVVTVFPVADVNFSPAAQTLCSGQISNIQIFSDVAGTTFTWTATGSSGNVSGFANGSGSLIAQTLTNSGNFIETVTYHVTPNANGCVGTASDVVVTVDPTPHVSTLPLAQTICTQTTINVSLTSTVAGSTFAWSCTPSSPNLSGYFDGNGNTISQTLGNSGYTIETVTYHITPTANGCDGPVTDYIVTVNPEPDVTNSPLTTQICSGTSPDINLTSNVAGTNFTWTASGSSGFVSGYSNSSGLVISQVLTNSGFNIESVTYHITPSANGCSGIPVDFTVTVYPVPDLSTSPLNKQLCNNTSTAISLTSDVSGTLFTWSCTPSSGNVTGFSDNFNPTVTLNQLLTNSGYSIETVTYHILPHANGCDGIAADYSVTVFPTPDLSNSPASEQICNNTPTSITLTSDVAGTLFTWTCTPSSAKVSGFLANPGTPTIILNQTLTNTGFNIETVTYHLTPHANGCTGTLADYIVTVYPVADVYFTPPAQTLCSQQTSNIQVLSHVLNTSFSWTASASSGNVTGFFDSNGNLISQTLTNSGNMIETVTYHVTPVANGCTGTSSNVVVTINPVPYLTTTPLAQSKCTQTSFTANLTSTVAGSTFSWTCTPSSGTLSGFSNGNGNTITQTISNTGFTIETVTYHITPSANGCTGPVTDYIVTVFPKPDVSNSPLTSQICSGNSPNINLTSNVAGTNFSWTATPSSGNIIGWSAGTGLVINQVLTNLGLNTETVTYSITPAANGCSGNTVNYIVTIVEIPDVYFNPPAQTICSQVSTNISLLSHVVGTTFTWSAAGSSGNVTGYSNGSGNTIAQLLTNSGTVIETVTYTVYPTAFGCPAGPSQNVVVTVNPKPVITNPTTSSSVCAKTSTNIVLQSSVAGSNFNWTASGSSPNVSGFSNGNGLAIIQTLNNTGFNIETVNYTVTPVANNCNGAAVLFTVTVFPVADVYFTPPSQAICSGTSCDVNLSSHVLGTSFTWSAAGSSGNVSGYSNGNGNLIQQLLNNAGTNIETVTYTSTPTANGCVGTSNPVVVTVNPLPVLSFTPCWDPVTTTGAQPFKLKGGIPSGGAYSGAGVNTGIFYPAISGAGTFNILYSYTNGFSCSGSTSQTITVIPSVPFTCGFSALDVRDNQSYLTVQIGTQCWMSVNLNYGNTISSTTMQRDNCTPEKYCFNDNPSNCTAYGGLYQWDEVMQYDNAISTQGFCPPEWHVPTESDWNTLFTNYISNGFAGSPLKYTGYSGFNVFLTGVRFDNTSWSFNSFAVLYWSSAAHGNLKAWAHGMNTFNPSVSYYPSFRSNAFSVRCTKD